MATKRTSNRITRNNGFLVSKVMGKMSSYIITEISIRQATASITEQSKLCLKVTAMVTGKSVVMKNDTV